MNCHLVINRGSGAGDDGAATSRLAGSIAEILTRHGHHVDTTLAPPGEIEAVLRRAIALRPDAILVGGGDGTVSTAARLLGGTGIPLGILPMGTFNLAARDLAIPLDPEEAAAFLATATSHPIDVLDVAGHACLCTTILGFYPEFSGIFERRDHGGRWWKKSLKLLTGLPGIFSRARPLRLAWRTDGETGHARTKFSAFVPGRYHPSPGLVPARTDFTAGTLTAYIGTQKTSAAALRGIFDYILGRQEQNPHLHIVKAPAVELRAHRRRHCTLMLDGEILRLPFPLHLRILPEHLHVLTTPDIFSTSGPAAAP